MTSFHCFLLHFIFILLHIGLTTKLATFGIHVGNETDRLALIAFKNMIYGDPLQVMRSWNDSHHFCEWQGITCSRRHQRVLMLNLTSQTLSGSLSPSIGNLSFLRTINLHNNNFKGEIPREVGRLFRLKEINMSMNSFEGKFPVNLSHCSNLRLIVLSRNKLEGSIPKEIGSLSKLVFLSLYLNNLTGEIPTSFGNLSSLNLLYLGQNSLGGSIPSSLGQLKNLKGLELGPNLLSGIIPHSLYNLSSLEAFAAPVNQLVDSLPHEIGLNLPNLKLFLIGGNQFFGLIPVSIFNASRLERLSLGYNHFTGKITTEVRNLKALQRLHLGMNNLGSGKSGDLNFLNSLTNATNLQDLSIANNRFGGKLPNSIANLSNQLNSLYLDDNQIFGGIPSGIENLVNLIVLTMNNNFLTGSIPKGIGMLQKLQALDLSANRFSGYIPHSLGNNTHIYYLNLSNNLLVGNIISDFHNYHFLQYLDLSENHLNGRVIGLSSPLILLNLANNSFTGSLPSEFSNLKNLGTLDVSENNLSGEIPSTLGSCISLEYLFLQGNFFQGSIPSFFSSLKNLQDLDLSRNNLSDQIPKDLENLSFLQNLNLSFNDLEGEVPVKGVFQNVSAFAFVGNSKLCGGISILQLPACPNKKSKKMGTSLSLKVAIGVILFVILVPSIFALYWSKRPRRKLSPSYFFGDWHKRVSYNGLHKATNGFSSANLIGMGNYGSVYKGVLHPDEIPIAVKVLNLNVRGASKSFISECKALRKVRHRNLLKTITACSSVDFRGNDFKALVFYFMPNGSLENWLHQSSNERHLSRNILNLHQRLSVAIDIASALDYLHNHCQTPIIHCDLKPSNVLLDDDMTAHVGDFGLAKILARNTSNSSDIETNSISILIKGSIGYIPPEYGMGTEVSVQGDVYSYGILLLEMFTGKRPTDEIFKDGLSLHHFSKMALTERATEIMDPRIILEENHNAAFDELENQRHNTINKVQGYLVSIFKIGVGCSIESPGDRMEIKDVLTELHMIKKMFDEDGIH